MMLTGVGVVFRPLTLIRILSLFVRIKRILSELAELLSIIDYGK